MPVNLDATEIVESFKSRLPSMGFISQSYIADIEKHLDVLIDIHNGVKRHRGYSRFAKTKAAHWLWEKFLWSSLAAITDNLRGYHDLTNYFTQYIRYENLLFAVDPHHRDHVIHSIWVMLIGFYLLDTCKPISPIDYSSILHGPREDLPNLKLCETNIKQREPILWCLIALTHDLGYPIQKTRAANELMSSMIDNFGFLEQQHFTYKFTTLQNTAIEELLNMLSASIWFMQDNTHKIIYNTGFRLEYAKSFERLDHGIMSAYLLINYIDHICETMSVPSNPDFSITLPSRSVSQAIIIYWLRAIASHTDKNRYSLAPNDMDMLLVIADELDEFSRYSHDIHLDRWVMVNCQTTFTCTKKSIRLEYTFPVNPEFDHLSFFKNKVVKLMDRFQLKSGGIELISITSTHYKPKKTKYHYERRFSDIEGTVRRINGNTAKDIHKWIAGEEVL